MISRRIRYKVQTRLSRAGRWCERPSLPRVLPQHVEIERAQRDLDGPVRGIPRAHVEQVVPVLVDLDEGDVSWVVLLAKAEADRARPVGQDSEAPEPGRADGTLV